MQNHEDRKEEKANGNLSHVNFPATLSFQTQGEVLMDRFTWDGQVKNIGSMFIGTSPELEMATYTVCFLARPNSLCPVQMASQQFQVQTWTIFDNLVGSAYPDIP